MNTEDKVKLYKEIQAELLDEQDIEISLEEIHSIVNSQFKIMAYGFSKGIGTVLPYVGKFIPFDMDYYSEKIIIPNKKLQSELIEQGQADVAKQVFIDSYKRYRQVVKETANEKEIDIEELLTIPNIDGSSDNLNIFKDLR